MILFFVLGMNQKMIFDSLIEKKFFIEKKVIVFTTLNDLIYPKDVEVIFIGKSSFSLFNLIRIKKRFNNIIKVIDGSTELYTPHLVNFLSNFFAFECSNIKVRKLIYDGVLNFIEAGNMGLDARWVRHQKIQKIKSWIFGLRYNHINEKITGESVINFDEFIFPTRIDTYPTKKSRIITPNWNCDNFNKKVCLVLEQPLIDDSKNQFLSELIPLLKSKDLNKIIVKSHPTLPKSILFEELRRRLTGYEVRLFEQKHGAEQVIAEFKVGVVISSNSTALLNAKLFFPPVDAISVGMKYSSRNVNNLKRLFIKNNITVV